MSAAIVSLISVAMVLIGVMTMAQGSFRSVATLSDSWKQMEVRSGAIARTNLEVLSVSLQAQLIDVTLRNSGQTSLRDFDSWDLVVQYYQASGTYHQRWLPYTTSNPPANNQWTVVGIYADAGLGTPEAFQPGILDPGEEMVIRVKVSPAANPSATNQIIIGTPNGVSVSAIF